MSIRTHVLISLLAGALLSLGLVALFPLGVLWIGWLTGALLLSAAAYFLISAWRWGGGGKMLAWLVALAFLLRLGLGVALDLGLPVLGYPEPEQKAGYVFYDAYRRDTQAWNLAIKNKPLLAAFGKEFATDQYGGLLALSAVVYRYFSPDVQRPYLILILGAFVFALGLPFFFKAVGMRWGPGVAALAAWILVLYPDGILFSSSQMREPFLIGLTGIAFWGVIAWGQPARRAPGLAVGLALLFMTLFSSRVVLVIAGVLAVWFFLDHFYERIPGRWKLAVWAAFALAGIGLVAVSWKWFVSSSAWDMLLSGKVSGHSENAIQQIGDVFRPLFYTVYGLARPLLPAAIATIRPPWIWKTLDIFRATGYYALLPLLFYSFWSLWKARPAAVRRTLLWFAAAVLVWMVISSARAGGDQWDNPRYRTIFLPWLALLAGWGLHWALEHRDAWLPRIVAVEVIFLGFFTQWYLARYWDWLHWNRLSFWMYPAMIVVLSALVLVGGWLWDRLRGRRLPAR